MTIKTSIEKIQGEAMTDFEKEQIERMLYAYIKSENPVLSDETIKIKIKRSDSHEKGIKAAYHASALSQMEELIEFVEFIASRSIITNVPDTAGGRSIKFVSMRATLLLQKLKQRRHQDDFNFEKYSEEYLKAKDSIK